ncbi:radical SAM protein [bacterium]|nr:radical SAM protein [bacterium]
MRNIKVNNDKMIFNNSGITGGEVREGVGDCPVGKERASVGETCSGWWSEDDPRRPYDPDLIFRTGLRWHHLSNTAYPIGHRRTIWSYRQSDPEVQRYLLKAGLERSGRMSLYIHIPFCERRCRYCEYTVVENHTEADMQLYQRSLLAELDLYASLLEISRLELVGFDIGGGTPLLCRADFLSRLIERVRSHFKIGSGFGISIETTPKLAAERPERLGLVRAAGVERISMGLQMINPRLLAEYGRSMNRVGYNRQAVENIRAAGFELLNIDLMYGFASQTIADFRRSLEYTLNLAPEYITLYRMRYKGTVIEAESSAIELSRVMAMYAMASELLNGAGYQAQPGKNTFSRRMSDPGTSAYLTERVLYSTPYLGLGLGAQTFTNTILAYNCGAAEKRLPRYVRAIEAGRLPIQDLYHLPLAENMAKMISVSFYFGQIHLAAFRDTFGFHVEQWFPEEVKYVLEHDLMEYAGPVLRLTSKGALHFNGVIALFYSDRVKQYLLGLGEEKS